MSALLELQDRRVIPNWRDFRRTAQLGELNSNNGLPDKEFETSYLSKYIRDWDSNRNVGYAADLLNACFIAGVRDIEELSEACKFLLAHKDSCSKELCILAEHFTTPLAAKKPNIILEHQTFEELKIFLENNNLYHRISFLKQKVQSEPLNGFAWVELARTYTIVGAKEKAIKAMKIACELYPNNRFIIRCACRLYVHYGQLDQAAWTLKKCTYTSTDPWLMSVEISVSLLLNKTSNLVKPGLQLVNSRSAYPKNISELSSSIATVEYYNDKINSSKKLFRTSLLSPNDNTLAQAEWARSKHLHLEINEELYRIDNPFEALAIESFEKSDLSSAFSSCQNWLLDLPYSKRPVTMGTYIGALLKRFDEAEELSKIGMRINPNSADLVNNYCYLLGINGKPSEGLKEMNKLAPFFGSLEDTQKIVLQATSGLLYYRSGIPETGQQAYKRALENCRKINNEYLYQLGLLNFLREEFLSKGELLNDLMNEAKDLFKSGEFSADVEFLKRQLKLDHDINI